jgi:hypothetical protein
MPLGATQTMPNASPLSQQAEPAVLSSSGFYFICTEPSGTREEPCGKETGQDPDSHGLRKTYEGPWPDGGTNVIALNGN